MQISLDNAMKAVSDFMTEQVNTIHDPLKYSIGLFVVGALSKNPEGILAKARPWLEMSGILSDGMVDVDVFKAGLDNMLKKPILSNRLFCVFAIWITWSNILKTLESLVFADVGCF